MVIAVVVLAAVVGRRIVEPSTIVERGPATWPRTGVRSNDAPRDAPARRGAGGARPPAGRRPCRAGRVVVVEGPAGIGKSSLLAAAARAADGGGMPVAARLGRAARAARPPGASPASSSRRCTAARSGPRSRSARRASRAGPSTRTRPTPPLAGDAVHAAAHGLTWLAAGLAERGPTLLVRRRRPLGRRAVPALAGPARAASCRSSGSACSCAVRTGEPPADPLLLAELLAAAPDPPVVPRPLGPAAAGDASSPSGSRPRGRRSPTPATPPAPATRSCCGRCSTTSSPRGSSRRTTSPRGSAPSGPAQVARSVELQLSRLPAGATALARAFAVLGRDTPLRLAGELAGLETPAAGGVADHLRGAGLLTGDGGRHALVHPLVASALYAGLPPGERASWHARAAELLARDGADAESVALHLLRTEPGRDPATVAVLREAAARASVRGAPESAAVLLRRALAEPPPDRAVEADVRGELGLALAVHVQPGAAAMLEDAVRLAVTPAQRAPDRARRGADAWASSGSPRRPSGCAGTVSSRPSGVAPELRTRLEAELMVGAWLQAATVAEARERLRRRGAAAAGMWRIHAAWEAVYDARPADEPRRLLAAALRDGPATDDGAESLLETIALLGLIAVRRARHRDGALRRARRRRPAAGLARRAGARELPARDGARACRADPRRRGRRPAGLRLQGPRQPAVRGAVGRSCRLSTRSWSSTSSTRRRPPSTPRAGSARRRRVR